MTANAYSDFQQYEVSNEHLSLTVIPELGGKVASLRSSRGMEWLAPPVRPPKRPGPAQVFTDGDVGGWDECAPNISPTSGLVDHGELWNQPWAVEHGDQHLTMTAQGSRTPFRLTRTLQLSAHSLIADYTLTNTGTDELSWTWAAHILLAIDPGARIRFPQGTSVIRDAGPNTLVSAAIEPWPIIVGQNSVDECVLGAGVAVKLFTTHASWAALIRNDAWLLIRTDQAVVRRFGLWVNYGGYPPTNPWHHVGLEPSIGDCDDLAVADARGTAHRTQPGAAETWSFRITLGTGTDDLARVLGLWEGLSE